MPNYSKWDSLACSSDEEDQPATALVGRAQTRENKRAVLQVEFAAAAGLRLVTHAAAPHDARGRRTEWAFAVASKSPPPPERGRTTTRSLSWRATPSCEAAIAAELASQLYCVVDGFLAGDACARLADEVAAAWRAGRLHKHTTGLSLSAAHVDGVNTRAQRSDHMGWFVGNEAFWQVLPDYLAQLSRLVGQLRQSPRTADLAGCVQRSPAMVTCYPGNGTRYHKHCDNMCNDGDGRACNGRRLTAIFYLNASWRARNGGELLIYPRLVDAGQTNPRADAASAAASGRVAPLFNRLVLFYADVRVPHEVLPSYADRFAVTVWYYDTEEARRAGAGAGAR